MIRVGSSEDHGLSLDVIQIDGGTQSRATLNQHVVDDYAEAIKAGATFPPIVVFYDGKKHWLADGFHRFHAYQKAGKAKVAADIRQGTRRDAILHSVGANETHGLRRTRDDKRRAVMTLLNDAEWAAKPERWIATTANVSHTYVQKIRAEHLATLPDRPAEVEVERGGTVYTQKVAKAKPAVVMENLATDATTPEPIISKASEPEIAAEVTTPSRTIVAEILALWNEASEAEREEVRAFINSPAPEQKTAGHAPRDMGSDGANAGGNDVDGSAKRAGHAGQPFDALSGQVETRNSDNFVEWTTSGPDAKRAQFSPPDGDAFSEVKGTARPENAAGVEPSPSVAVADPQAPRPSATAEISDLPVSSSRQVGRAEAPSSSPGASAALHCPANPAVADGQPSTPTPDALAAGQGAMPGSNAKSGDAVTSPKPGCLSPDSCRIKFQTSALCWKCRDAQIKARAA